MQSFDFIIAGGGLSGLSHAWELEQAGHSVLVLERQAVPGGAVRSIREDGFLMDLGANTLQVTSTDVEQWLIRAIGDSSGLIRANELARKRFILRNGKPEAVPMSPGQFIRTPLFSARAKLRLMSEPFRQTGPEGDESLASFVKRRFGPGVIDYGLNPVIAGIHAGDPGQLSVNLAFPKLKQWEQQHGSVFRGALKSRRNQPRFRSYSVNFTNGLATLTDALAAKLATAPVCSCKILSLTKGGPGWVAGYEAAGYRDQATAANLIIATPAHALHMLPLPGTLLRDLSPLRQIPYPPVSVLGLGYNRSNVGHPLDGFGVLIPECERLPVLGTLFSSTLFPNRAPAGQVLLTTFIGGTRQPQIPLMPPAEQIDLARSAIEKILRIRGKPTFSKLHVWPHAIPQRNLGCDKHIQLLQDIEANHPGLRFIGNYRSGISLTNCIQAAMRF